MGAEISLNSQKGGLASDRTGSTLSSLARMCGSRCLCFDLDMDLAELHHSENLRKNEINKELKETNDAFYLYIERMENLKKLDCAPPHSPKTFLQDCTGHLQENGPQLEGILEWKKKNNIDNILWEPQPYFEVIKKWSPHFWHGRDRCGRPVYYDLLGKIDAKMGQAEGVTIDIYLRHCIFCSEFLWNVIDPRPDQQMIAIMDVKGIGIHSLTGFALEIFQKQSKINAAYYPGRCYKTFIVNAPSWFNILCPVVKNALDPKTKESLLILNSDFTELYKYIDPTEIPPQYGGSSVDLGFSCEERAIKEVIRRNAG